MFSPATYQLVVDQLSGKGPQVVLVLANLFPIYAVLEGSWDVGSLILLYWAENLIIGFYSLLKILLAGYQSPLSILPNLFVAAFFCIHYGGFVGIHGIFVIGFFPLGGEAFSMNSLNWPFFFVFPEVLVGVIQYLFSHMPELMLGGFVLLFVSHGISFIINYLLRREFRVTDSREQMGAPYGRIIVMHITILAGAFFVMTVGSNLPFLFILIALKTCMDLGLHHRSHSKVAPETDGEKMANE